MNKYEIVTSQGNLDVYPDIDIAITYAIDDILDISRRNTSWSKTIELPGTPDNNIYFSHIYDVNIDNREFNPVIRIPVTIRVGTNDVLKGYMQLMNITILNKEIVYEISIAGSFKNIISQLGEATLGNLDLSEYNHTRTHDGIVQSWDYNIWKNGNFHSLGEPGDGYVYPYIINGNSQDIYNNFYTYDAFPAVYTKTIMSKLFDYAGYTVTSKFLDSDYFKKLICPYTGDKLQMTDEEFSLRSVKIGITPTYIQATTFQNRGDDWFYNNDTSFFIGLDRESGTVTQGTDSGFTFSDVSNQFTDDIFTCAKTGRYNVDFIGHPVIEIRRTDNDDIEYKEGTFQFRWQMILTKASNASQIILDSSVDLSDPNDIYGVIEIGLSAGIHPSPWFDDANAEIIQINANADNILLEVGDTIKIRFGFRYPDAVKFIGLQDSLHQAAINFKQSLGGDFTRFIVEPATNESYGNDDVNMNQILDKTIKLKDFFYDIINMFNLVIQDNPNKINDIIIEPKDDFFASKQKVLDWDAEHKLDNDSVVKITPMSELDAKIYNYTYTADDDFFNKQYTQETKRIYGDYKEEIQNDFSDKTSEIKIGFAPTLDSQQGINSRVAPFFVEYSDEAYSPKKVKQRILFFGGKIGGAPLNIKDYPGALGSNKTTTNYFGYCGAWDNPFNPQHSLCFGREDKIYFNSGGIFPTQNLFEEFHKTTLNSITDTNAKLLECTVWLTPKDVALFDFRDIVFLLSSYWRVVKIVDFNPVASDRLTKVILYKIIDLDIISKYQVQVPTSNSSCPVDIVAKKSGKNTYYYSQSGQEITADCCKQVGGTYMDGVCKVSLKVKPFKPFKPSIGGVLEPHNPTQIVQIIGGSNVIPIMDEQGPLILSKNNSTRNTIGGIKTIGTGNYVPKNSQKGLIIGNNSSIAPNLVNTVVFGDGISANQSNTIYLGNVKIDQSGNVLLSGIVIIDGGEDDVFNFNKTNPVEIIDGTRDAVRNPNGTSWSRPIIDGGLRY